MFVTRGWLKIKYASRQHAISPQPVAQFKKKIVKPLNPDTSPNRTVYNVPTAP